MEDKQICYVVSVSFGSYEDHYERLDGVYLSKEAAVVRQGEITEYYESKNPFPLTWCTEAEYLNLDTDKLSTDELIAVDRWYLSEEEKYDFGGVYIKETELR